MIATVCTWGGGPEALPAGAEEVLTLGRTISTLLRGDLHWLILGPLPGPAVETAGRYAVAGIDRVADPKLTGFQPDACVEALAQYCAQRSPRVLLVSQTFDARLVAPRLAGRAGAAVIMNAVDVEADAAGRLLVTAAAYGGDTRAVYQLTDTRSAIVAVSPSAVVPEPREPPARRPAVHDIRVDLSRVEERIRVVERAPAQGPRLEDADIIVAGGRGLGAREHYQLVEDLAAALGGVAGATRPIVDEGWVDPSRQVGLTGKITRPALYIAAGISGASQHMVGCAAAKTIVAINRDPDAAVFRYARFGIVGDCLEILPELIRAVKER